MKKTISFFLSFIFIFSSFTMILISNNSFVVSAATVYETPYYYYQMSDDAQKTYDILKEAVLSGEKKVKIKYDIDQNDFEQIAELLILHDPMTFNLKDIEAETVTNNYIILKLSYRYTYESYQKMVSKYDKEVNKILAKLDDDMTTYSKIKIIHDSIASSAIYDVEYKLSDTIYGTLVKKRAKCDGYAKTFSYICGQAGIRTVTVIGTDVYTTDDSLHMWNKVYYNKNWYNIDVTWDDPVSNNKSNRRYDFFMVSDKDFSKSHTEDNLSFTVPSAKDSSKSYFKVYKKYAEDLAEAKSIIKTEIEKAAKSGKTYITLQCSTDKVYDSVCNYVLDVQKICNVLEKVKNKNLITEVYSYGFNDVHKTIKIYIFYKKTDLSDYFVDVDEVEKQMKNTLNGYGIK